MRYENPLPMHWLFSTNEFTATISPARNTAPPESPKHRPPVWALPGFDESCTLKPSVRALFKLLSLTSATYRLSSTISSGFTSWRP